MRSRPGPRSPGDYFPAFERNLQLSLSFLRTTPLAITQFPNLVPTREVEERRREFPLNRDEGGGHAAPARSDVVRPRL